MEKRETFEDGTGVNLYLWDTAGDFRYKTIIKSFFKDARAVLVCFSVANKASLDMVEKWVKDARVKSNSYPLIIMVGTQSDLEHQVTKEQAEEI